MRCATTADVIRRLRIAAVRVVRISTRQSPCNLGEGRACPAVAVAEAELFVKIAGSIYAATLLPTLFAEALVVM